MLAKIGKFLSSVGNFIFVDLYGWKFVKKRLGKDYYSNGRATASIMIAGFSTGIGGATGAFALMNGGGIGGAALGSLIGTFIFPGAGTIVGGFIGGMIGQFAGSLIGYKIGAEIGGLCGAFFAKHLTRLISAIFNFRETNPTNPNKYKIAEKKLPLAKDTEKPLNADELFNAKLEEIKGIKDQHGRQNSMPDLASYRQELLELGKQCQNEAIDAANEELANLYKEKQKLKPLFCRITGFPHFWATEQKTNEKNEINNKVTEIRKNNTFKLFRENISNIEKNRINSVVSIYKPTFKK